MENKLKKETAETYVKPEMEIIEMSGEAVVTASCTNPSKDFSETPEEPIF